MSCKTVSVVVILVWIGCVDAQDASLPVGSSGQTLVFANKLSANKLSANKLSANKLSANKLSANRLADESLGLNLDASEGLETTEAGREVLEYLARCALDEGDVLAVTHEDVTYHFPGVLGVAPEWEHRALTGAERERVSACLFSHVNAFGSSVVVSARALGVLDADPAERAAYPVYEGTFFGAFFAEEGGDEAAWYACQGDEPALALALSSDRALRVCTDGNSDCLIESPGRCRDVCEERSAEHGWRRCWAHGTLYTETLSTFLRADLAEVERCDPMESCAGEDRLSSTPGAAAILDCAGSVDCAASCSEDSRCTLDGAAAATFLAIAETGSSAAIQCMDTGTCAAQCKAGSTCEIDCRNAGTCTGVQCAAGASCLLDCSDAESCSFLTCPGGATSCPGDIVVCGRSCP